MLIGRLAELAERACFAREPPDRAAASEAWALEQAARRLVLRRRMVRRVVLAMDPRPLWWSRQRVVGHRPR